jgi:hypothetical protein
MIVLHSITRQFPYLNASDFRMSVWNITLDLCVANGKSKAALPESKYFHCNI